MNRKRNVLLGASSLLLSSFLFAAPQVIQSQPVGANVTQGVSLDAFNDLQQTVLGLQDGLNELLSQMQALQKENRQLTGQVEELTYLVDKLSKESKTRYVDTDQRLQDLQSQLDQESIVVPVVPENRPELPTQQKLDAKEQYDEAKSYIRSQEYDKAIAGFTEFVQKNPDHELAANAYYWLGQVYYSLGDAQESEKALLTVIDSYPESNKVADSSYKLGFMAEQKGAKEEAKRYYDAVIADFPNTSAAQYSQRQLEKM